VNLKRLFASTANAPTFLPAPTTGVATAAGRHINDIVTGFGLGVPSLPIERHAPPKTAETRGQTVTSRHRLTLHTPRDLQLRG
jgi:hypothetical protein